MVCIINLKEPGSTYSHSHRLEDTQSIAIAFKAWMGSSQGKPESHALKLQKQKEEEKFRWATRVQQVAFFFGVFQILWKGISNDFYINGMLMYVEGSPPKWSCPRAWILRFYCDPTPDKLNHILSAFPMKTCFGPDPGNAMRS